MKSREVHHSLQRKGSEGTKVARLATQCTAQNKRFVLSHIESQIVTVTLSCSTVDRNGARFVLGDDCLVPLRR